MVYKTHVLISHCEEDREYYLVEGIEYPNLITDGSTLEEAKEMAKDAWSLLCVVYEDKNLKIDNILSEEYIEETRKCINPKWQWIFEIESEDTDEYRKSCPDNSKKE